MNERHRQMLRMSDLELAAKIEMLDGRFIFRIFLNNNAEYVSTKQQQIGSKGWTSMAG